MSNKQILVTKKAEIVIKLIILATAIAKIVLKLVR